MRRIYQLEELIESNRAPVEARLQAKLAYEHFEYGALPCLFLFIFFVKEYTDYFNISNSILIPIKL